MNTYWPSVCHLRDIQEVGLIVSHDVKFPLSLAFDSVVSFARFPELVLTPQHTYVKCVNKLPPVKNKSL